MKNFCPFERFENSRKKFLTNDDRSAKMKNRAAVERFHKTDRRSAF